MNCWVEGSGCRFKGRIPSRDDVASVNEEGGGGKSWNEPTGISLSTLGVVGTESSVGGVRKMGQAASKNILGKHAPKSEAQGKNYRGPPPEKIKSTKLRGRGMGKPEGAYFPKNQGGGKYGMVINDMLPGIAIDK